VLEPTDALRRRLVFVLDRVRDTGGRGSRSIVVDTGSFSRPSLSEPWNTSSGGTFSPSVRITRAILRLRASAVLICFGVVGVGRTSKEELVKRGVACTRASEDDRGTVSRKMRGRGVAPVRSDLAACTTGTSDSTEESDVLRSESLEDEAVEENGNGELSVLARGWSSNSER
jgi:hypothetical protein